jgi:hypothetical protein
MCIDLNTGEKSCTCGDECGKMLSQRKQEAKAQERYHEYIKRMYRETEEG